MELILEGQIRNVSSFGAPRGARDSFSDIYRSWLEMAPDLLVELDVEQAARVELERRYLAGHRALFDDVGHVRAELEPLARLVRSRMAELVERLPRSIEPAPPSRSIDDRIDARVVYLRDCARSAAYALLGDHAGADAVDEELLRAKAEAEPQSAAMESASAGPEAVDVGRIEHEADEPRILRRGRWHASDRRRWNSAAATPASKRP